MSNIALLILLVMYVGICAFVVGYWTFGTITSQEKSIQDTLDIEFDEYDEDDIF
mgnify:CR=1